MKHALKLLIALMVTNAIISCEKVVDVDLRDADRKYVIEGIITDQVGKTRVKISETKPFSGSNDFEGVNGATVSITEVGGTESTLLPVAPGVYESSFRGVPGMKYTLKVIIEGKEFMATSQMPEPVSIEEVFITDMSMGSMKGLHVNVVYQDPIKPENKYRFVEFINGKQVKQIFTRNDDLSNGRSTTASLMLHEGDIKMGDTLSVEMQTIDLPIYKYWYALDLGADGSSSGTPANPTSNIKGGALGYFSAHSVREKTIIVQ